MLVSAFLMSVVSFFLADTLPSIELRLARDDCTCTSKTLHCGDFWPPTYCTCTCVIMYVYNNYCSWTIYFSLPVRQIRDPYSLHTGTCVV